MDSEAFAESLAYPQVKKRAVASRSFRVKINPSNGNLFSAGATINIDLPGNLAGQYYNSNQMYLKFAITPSADIRLDRGGALSFIKRIQIQTAGAQIFDLNNWNVLATALMDTDSTSEYKANGGSIMMGTLGDQLQGEELIGGATRIFCVPLILNPLALTTPHRLIPAFSLSSIQFKITLENGINVGKAGGAGTTYAVDNVELVSLMTELSPGAQAQIDQLTGRKYNILATSYINSQANLVATNTGLTANLGVSVSSLERIFVIHRNHTTEFDRFNLGNRARAGLKQFQFLINSENYPQRPIEVQGQSAEAYAEMLIADHALVDFKKGGSIKNGFQPHNGAAVPPLVGAMTEGYSALSGTCPGLTKSPCFTEDNPDGTTAGTVPASGAANANAVASDIGTFLCACEFESGLSDGKSSHIYSGISTIASTIQYIGTYANTSPACAVDFFSQYTILMSLDMAGSGVFAVSV